jgi:alanyl-tRNA synthetase
MLGLEQLEEMQVVTYLGTEIPFRKWKEYLPQLKMYLPDHLEDARPSFALHLFDQSKRPRPPHGVNWIPGDELFKLHDTFGLRPDFVEDVVRNYGLTIDRAGYEAEMAKQRDRARSNWKGQLGTAFKPVYGEAWKVYRELPEDFNPDQTPLVRDAKIVALILDDQLAQRVPAGAKAEVFLDSTPFYAESGGQVGDAGELRNATGEAVLAHVDDAKMVLLHLTSHFVRTLEPLEVGMSVRAMVDARRRAATRRNHTATHLLHAALRTTLGTHVKQAGSLVAPDRLRFDFTHYAALDEQDLLDVEDLVNERILANNEVHTEVMELEAAVASGATALFDEKYGAQVRVVSVEGFSKELCGGTHVRQTGDIGLFKIISEGSVAAGIRRIEALTGEGVLNHFREASETLALLSQALRAKPDELLAAVEKLAEAEKKLRKELEALQMKRAAAQAGRLVETAAEVKGVRVVAAHVEAMDRNALRQMVDELRPKLESGVIVLGTVLEGKVALIAAVTQDLTKRLDAGKIVKAAAVMVEGSGGGRKDLAEAGGKNQDKLAECLRAVPSIVEKML